MILLLPRPNQSGVFLKIWGRIENSKDAPEMNELAVEYMEPLVFIVKFHKCDSWTVHYCEQPKQKDRTIHFLEQSQIAYYLAAFDTDY